MDWFTKVRQALNRYDQRRNEQYPGRRRTEIVVAFIAVPMILVVITIIFYLCVTSPPLIDHYPLDPLKDDLR